MQIIFSFKYILFHVFKSFIRISHPWDFPGSAGVKNPPANAGDMGSSPGTGRSHMPWSK